MSAYGKKKNKKGLMMLKLHAGYRTQSGHAAFSESSSKPWESGQRPRTLQPEEMPWARGRSPDSPQKPLTNPSRTLSQPLGSGLIGSDSSDGLIRQQQCHNASLTDDAASALAGPSNDGAGASQPSKVSNLSPVCNACLSKLGSKAKPMFVTESNNRTRSAFDLFLCTCVNGHVTSSDCWYIIAVACAGSKRLCISVHTRFAAIQAMQSFADNIDSSKQYHADHIYAKISKTHLHALCCCQ